MHPKIRELDSLLRRLEGSKDRPSRPPVSSGCGPLDAALPGRGFRQGSLVEWLAEGPGCGAGMLALRAAREACRGGGALVVIDPHHHFYPPAAAAWGVDLQNTIVVRATQPSQNQWALDQALRCPHVAAVVAWPRQLDSRAFRRLQLAVETSGCLGLLVRPVAAKRESSWADVRLLISPVGQAPADSQQNKERKVAAERERAERERVGGRHTECVCYFRWRLRIALLRCRGGSTERTVDVEIDERTGDIHAADPGNLVTQLADSAVDSRQARA